ncbi:lengsin [Strongylocentrotus purpuratus]|uniref:Lengsin n=1 Tax=Strongylocentrotus purpuratus TaxID=7668 RepID=A0A7M7RGW9_STRPU|nr:lengsin [Strongylocentrotus purpuratus]XP_793759.1 lengsin [Strongylocentrotus purpuratus]|eukprot:XP_793759.1 PREDICTED: lengsin [Strongylocentrotus purpuratus]
MDVDKIQAIIKKNGISTIRYEMPDVYGISHCRLYPAASFSRRSSDGVKFSISTLMSSDPQGNLATGTGYGEEIGFSNCLAFPDLETFQVVPWAKATARVLMNPTIDGLPVVGYPRYVARLQIAKLNAVGYTLLSTNRYEFYVENAAERKPIFSGRNFGATVRLPKAEGILEPLCDYLPQVGFDILNMDTGHGPGQIGMAYQPAFGLKAADNASKFRTSTKEIALRNSHIASFMTKPYTDGSGSCGHFIHSIWDTKRKHPMLFDKEHPTGLSKNGRHWVAGILSHVPGLAVLMCPTINCVKRFEPNQKAPVNATWGYDNCSTAVRVRIMGDRGTFIENRLPGSGCNPYIVMAATIAAGLDGIANKLPLPPPVKGDVMDEKTLPQLTTEIPNNIHDALSALVADTVLCDALGDEFINCFLSLKQQEDRLMTEAMASGNKDWEYGYYFEYM